jgi:TrkA domain protein
MKLTEAHREVPGIVTRQFSITADSPFQNQPMGKACIRTRCGVSIVAIMREGEVVPSPGPDVVLHTGDLLVAVGTQEGLDTAADILRNG